MDFKKQLFTLWDATGKVSYESAKYVGESFRTMDDYYVALKEYYNLGDDVDIMEYVGETAVRLMNENSNNPKVDFKFVSLKPLFKTDSYVDMDIIKNGMSGIHSFSFTYGVDPDYICTEPDEYRDNLECFEYEVIVYAFRDVDKQLRDMFGLRFGRISSEPHRDE